jgi:hypothetical protein
MTRFQRWILVAVALAAPLGAEQHSNGYLFVAPGGITGPARTNATVHLGVGGELALPKGVGAGAELGALGPTDNFADVLGVFSANGYYHFLRRSGKLDPFATAGYSLFFRNGRANLFNFGGGMNYWFLSRVGFRGEIRDHVYWNADATLHYWGVRFGLAFR